MIRRAQTVVAAILKRVLRELPYRTYGRDLRTPPGEAFTVAGTR